MLILVRACDCFDPGMDWLTTMWLAVLSPLLFGLVIPAMAALITAGVRTLRERVFGQELGFVCVSPAHARMTEVIDAVTPTRSPSSRTARQQSVFDAPNPISVSTSPTWESSLKRLRLSVKTEATMFAKRLSIVLLFVVRLQFLLLRLVPAQLEPIKTLLVLFCAQLYTPTLKSLVAVFSTHEEVIEGKTYIFDDFSLTVDDAKYKVRSKCTQCVRASLLMASNITATYSGIQRPLGSIGTTPVSVSMHADRWLLLVV